MIAAPKPVQSQYAVLFVDLLLGLGLGNEFVASCLELMRSSQKREMGYDSFLTIAKRELEDLRRRPANSDRPFRRLNIICLVLQYLEKISPRPESAQTIRQFLDRERLALPDILPTRLPNGCVVECRMTEFVQQMMWLWGVWEPAESYLFTRLIQPGMIVIDAGAYVGQYTLLAATRVGPTGQAHAFEPVPDNFRVLRRNVDRNNLSEVCVLNQSALWHQNTEVKLTLSEEPKTATDVSNEGAYSIQTCVDQFSRITAQAIRLDDYADVAGLPKIDLIKMDIEGAEPFALSGARTILQKYRPIIMLEVNANALRQMGTSPYAIWSELRPLGYRPWSIGTFAENSGEITDPENFCHEDTISNVFFYCGTLPEGVTKGWTLATSFEWARSKW